MKTVITGCHVHALSRNEFAYGDLIEFEDMYVLLSHLSATAINTQWMESPRGTSYCIVIVDGELFDNRGIIMFPKLRSVMNDAAKRYVFGDKAVKL